MVGQRYGSISKTVPNIFELLLRVGVSMSFTFCAWTRVIGAMSPTPPVFQRYTPTFQFE